MEGVLFGGSKQLRRDIKCQTDMSLSEKIRMNENQRINVWILTTE